MKRDCSICGSNRKTVVYQPRFSSPSACDNYTGYDVVVCERCDFAYADKVPPQAFFENYYKAPIKTVQDLAKRRSSQTDEGGFECESDVRLHVATLNTLKTFLNEEKRILDIGCGSGHLLSLFHNSGFKHLMGIEPSSAASAIARQEYGLNVITASLCDDIEAGEFDFIILSHVLEHVSELRHFLFGCASLMAEGGQIYVEVPDASRFGLSLDPKMDTVWEYNRDLFAQFCPEHINFFTSVSLTNLMVSCGFRKVFLEPQVSIMGVIASVWDRVPLQKDTTVLGALQSYIEGAEAACQTPMAIIEEILVSKQEILVWGAGLHTQRLLAIGKLGKLQIRAFVDSNPAYQGQQLAGRPIIEPAQARQFPSLPIMISSKRLQAEIAGQISAMGLPNPVLLLYPQAK
jgi:SAM-dependent methyltransferase